MIPSSINFPAIGNICFLFPIFILFLISILFPFLILIFIAVIFIYLSFILEWGQYQVLAVYVAKDDLVLSDCRPPLPVQPFFVAE